MILLFVATEGGTVSAPLLPDLNVQDSASGLDIKVAGLEGHDDDFIQTQAICYAPLQFLTSETGKTTGDNTGEYWCRRLSRIIVKPLFSANNGTCDIYPVRMDKNGIIAIGEKFTLTALSDANLKEGALFAGVSAEIETYGANKIYFYVSVMTNGTVNLRMAGV